MELSVTQRGSEGAAGDAVATGDAKLDERREGARLVIPPPYIQPRLGPAARDVVEPIAQGALLDVERRRVECVREDVRQLRCRPAEELDGVRLVGQQTRP